MATISVISLLVMWCRKRFLRGTRRSTAIAFPSAPAIVCMKLPILASDKILTKAASTSVKAGLHAPHVTPVVLSFGCQGFGGKLGLVCKCSVTALKFEVRDSYEKDTFFFGRRGHP